MAPAASMAPPYVGYRTEIPRQQGDHDAPGLREHSRGGIGTMPRGGMVPSPPAATAVAKPKRGTDLFCALSHKRRLTAILQD